MTDYTKVSLIHIATRAFKNEFFQRTIVFPLAIESHNCLFSWQTSVQYLKLCSCCSDQLGNDHFICNDFFLCVYLITLKNEILVERKRMENVRL